MNAFWLLLCPLVSNKKPLFLVVQTHGAVSASLAHIFCVLFFSAMLLSLFIRPNLAPGSMVLVAIPWMVTQEQNSEEPGFSIGCSVVLCSSPTHSLCSLHLHPGSASASVIKLRYSASVCCQRLEILTNIDLPTGSRDIFLSSITLRLPQPLDNLLILSSYFTSYSWD